MCKPRVQPLLEKRKKHVQMKGAQIPLHRSTLCCGSTVQWEPSWGGEIQDKEQAMLSNIQAAYCTTVWGIIPWGSCQVQHT